MSEFGHSTTEEAAQFAAEHSIDHEADLRRIAWPHTARLARFSDTGDVVQHFSEGGADYLFSQLDYSTDLDDEVRASRMIAAILAGNRTEVAYWVRGAAQKKISVHQGEGSLVVGQPNDNRTRTFLISPDVTPEVTLQPGSFYAFRAGRWTEEPLVVSGFYSPPVQDWSDFEVVVEHNPASVQDTVETPDGTLKVPMEFGMLYELRAC